MNISEEQLDRLGRLADSAANCAAFADMRAVNAPLPIIVDGMVSISDQIKNDLRALYVEISGTNPWEHHP